MADFQLGQGPSMLAAYVHCLKKRQIWNGIAQNYIDRFWCHLAQMFKRL